MKRLTILMIAILSVCTGCQPSGEGRRLRQLENARDALRQGEYEQAIAALDTIAEPASIAREFYLIRGLAHFKLREFHHAMDAFEKANPESLTLKSYMGYLYLLLGETQTAATWMNESQAAHGEAPAWDLLQGNIKLREQAFDDAQSTFRQVISRRGHPAHAYMGLANAALIKKDLETAEQYYLSALLASPDDVHAYLVLARFYMMMQREHEAEIHLLMGLQKQPGHLNAIILLGNLLIKQGRCAEALSLYHQYERALASSVLRFQALRCMFEEKQHEQAADILDAFQSKTSRHYLMLHGEFNLRKGDIEAALSDFYGIPASEADFMTDYYLGVISILKDDPDLALAYLNKSLQKNAFDTQTHLLTSVIYLSKHNYTEASKYAAWAANLEPNHIEAHLIQGVTAYLQERYDDALYAFDIVTEFASEHPVPYFFKALMSMRDASPVDAGVGRPKQPIGLAHFLDLRPSPNQSWAFQCDMTGAKLGKEFGQKTAFLDSLMQGMGANSWLISRPHISNGCCLRCVSAGGAGTLTPVK